MQKYQHFLTFVHLKTGVHDIINPPPLYAFYNCCAVVYKRLLNIMFVNGITARKSRERGCSHDHYWRIQRHLHTDL